MRPVILILPLLLAACVTEPAQMSDGSFIYEHGIKSTVYVARAAEKRCEASGQGAALLDTECGQKRCISKFRCE
jgi:hypothetical protein